MLMPVPVLTLILFIFIFWLQYQIRKSTRKATKDTELFWDKEKQSNLTRRADLSNLNYISLSTTTLPLDDKEDDTINSYRDTILKLSDKKMLNLTGFTNTQLKTEYGAANMKLLIEYDSNYTILVSMLHKWADRLYEKNFLEDAISVLEYAVSCRTDVTKTYRLLANIYKQRNTPEKIQSLMDTVSNISIPRKEELINDLKTLVRS